MGREKDNEAHRGRLSERRRGHGREKESQTDGHTETKRQPGRQEKSSSLH